MSRTHLCLLVLPIIGVVLGFVGRVLIARGQTVTQSEQANDHPGDPDGIGTMSIACSSDAVSWNSTHHLSLACPCSPPSATSLLPACICYGFFVLLRAGRTARRSQASMALLARTSKSFLEKDA